VQITWPLAAIDRYGQQPVPQHLSSFVIISANQNPVKNVHGTCNPPLFLNQTVDGAANNSRQCQEGQAATTRLSQQTGATSIHSSQSPPRIPKLRLKRLASVEGHGFEGKDLPFFPSTPDRPLTAIDKVRSVMQAYERDFGHLDNYQPIVGFPRGRMRARVLSVTPGVWQALVRLVLSRPLLTGAAPMHDGRTFQLNFWWLMQEAPRLLAQEANRRVTHPMTEPDAPRALAGQTPAERDSRRRRLGHGEQARHLAEIRARNPELADALERLGRSIRDEEEARG